MKFRRSKESKFGDIRKDLNQIGTHINQNIKYNITEEDRGFLVELSGYSDEETRKINEFMEKKGFQEEKK